MTTRRAPTPSRRRPPSADVLAAVRAALPGATRRLDTDDVVAVEDCAYGWLPPGSVDLVLTDPPFNIARDTNFHTWDRNTINSYRFDADKGWDSYSHEQFVALLGQWAAEFARVLRRGGTFAVFCADAYLSHLYEALTAAGLKPRRTLTWRKPNAVPVNRATMMMSACEYVVVGVKGARATFNSDVPTAGLSDQVAIEEVLVGDKAAAVVEKAVRTALASVTATGPERPAALAAAAAQAVTDASVEVARRVETMFVTEAGSYLRGCVPNHVAFNAKVGARLHPTEKPVGLLRYLVALLSRPGDVVLDPFAGSGSTGEAARDLGRRAVLVERDPEFFTRLAARLGPPSPGPEATRGS